MKKPEDIPQDVLMGAAAVVVMLPPFKSIEETGDAIERIARAMLAATAEKLPKLDNCGKYLAEDNNGQWHYVNHAGTWQGCPPPFPLTKEREAPAGWKWQMVPDYPTGQIVGACICGSWPGGECLKCPPTGEVNTAHKNSEEV